MKRALLGDILLAMGAIDRLQLQAALAHQRTWGTPLGRAVIEHRFCSRDAVMEALSRQTGLPLVDLDAEPPDVALAPLLTAKLARKHRVVPLRLEGRRQEVLVVAIAAPASLDAIDEVRSVARKQRVLARLAADDQLDRHIARLYEGASRRVPAAARNEPVPLSELELEPDAPTGAQPERERPVLLYGWTEQAARNLSLVLAAEGVSARVSGALEVLGCRPDDVVVSPLPAVESLLNGQHCHALLVVAGNDPDTDLERARRLGARGFLAAPLDVELLLRAVRRLKSSAQQARAAA